MLLMSTHKICFCGEIRKIATLEKVPYLVQWNLKSATFWVSRVYTINMNTFWSKKKSTLSGIMQTAKCNFQSFYSIMNHFTYNVLHPKFRNDSAKTKKKIPDIIIVDPYNNNTQLAILIRIHDTFISNNLAIQQSWIKILFCLSENI